MSLPNKTNQKKLLDALDHVDERYVAELVQSLKLPKEETKVITGKKSFAKSIRYAVAVAACALLLGAAIPVTSMLIGKIAYSNPASKPTGNVGETTAEVIETNAEVIETQAPETEPIVSLSNPMISYGWSPCSISDHEARDIITSYLAKDSDPNKLAYTYSVTCYAKYSSGTKAPVYAVMINSDRWNYEPHDRIEKVYYNPDNPNLHIDFIFPSNQPLLIYRADYFYTLNGAMKQGILSLTQLMHIRWGDREGGSFDSFVYPIWLSHNELVEIISSNPDTTGSWEFRCYGNYNGVYVIFADKKYKVWEPKETIETVNGITFVYPNENKLQVCANGTFYSLSEAFAKKILSAEQLAEVYKVYTMEKQIKTEFLAKYGHEFPDMVADDKEVIVKFEKISGDVYVAVIASKCYDNTKSHSETVNGITFTWVQQYDIHVYFHGEFLTLTEAYQRGLLTAEQLIEIHASYTKSFGEMFKDLLNTPEPC